MSVLHHPGIQRNLEAARLGDFDGFAFAKEVDGKVTGMIACQSVSFESTSDRLRSAYTYRGPIEREGGSSEETLEVDVYRQQGGPVGHEFYFNEIKDDSAEEESDAANESAA